MVHAFLNIRINFSKIGCIDYPCVCLWVLTLSYVELGTLCSIVFSPKSITLSSMCTRAERERDIDINLHNGACDFRLMFGKF
jgi:hypothetical protein